jgi:hypothetical protein
MDKRVCKECEQEKDISCYQKIKRKDKVYHYKKCKDCDKKRIKKNQLNYLKNRYRTDEEYKKQHNQFIKDWRERNKEKTRELSRQTYERHGEKYLLKMKGGYSENKNSVKDRKREYYLKNREKILKKAKERYIKKCIT